VIGTSRQRKRSTQEKTENAQMIHTLYAIVWVQDIGLEGLRFRFRSLQSHLPEVGPSIGIGT
jgi:hypothetical protein